MRHTVQTQRTVQELRPDDVNLVTLATCHVAGLFGQLLPTLEAGGTCILSGQFDAVAAAEEIERSGVTRIQTLPAQLAELLNAATADTRDLSSLRCAIVGGDVLALEVHERFSRITGLQATEVCGMTECFDYAMNPPFGEKRLGSIGRPPPGTELRLDHAGAVAAIGEPGEILVRSGGTMLGYWNDPAHTDAVLRDGWLRTGDVGQIDEDGWYWFVARSKELIIRGGSNVAPGQVEAVLHRIPASTRRSSSACRMNDSVSASLPGCSCTQVRARTQPSCVTSWRPGSRRTRSQNGCGSSRCCQRHRSASSTGICSSSTRPSARISCPPSD